LIILGLNAFHGGSSAARVQDGKLKIWQVENNVGGHGRPW
jgi:hypothetical protein